MGTERSHAPDGYAGRTAVSSGCAGRVPTGRGRSSSRPPERSGGNGGARRRSRPAGRACRTTGPGSSWRRLRRRSIAFAPLGRRLGGHHAAAAGGPRAGTRVAARGRRQLGGAEVVCRRQTERGPGRRRPRARLGRRCRAVPPRHPGPAARPPRGHPVGAHRWGRTSDSRKATGRGPERVVGRTPVRQPPRPRRCRCRQRRGDRPSRRCASRRPLAAHAPSPQERVPDDRSPQHRGREELAGADRRSRCRRDLGAPTGAGAARPAPRGTGRSSPRHDVGRHHRLRVDGAVGQPGRLRR